MLIYLPTGRRELLAVVSYLQVVDDGDGVGAPTDNYGSDGCPGSVLRIELQDVVVSGVVRMARVATCNALYVILLRELYG